jgi:hypothetical protein
MARSPGLPRGHRWVEPSVGHLRQLDSCPIYRVKRGKTPVLKADQARQLLDSIDTGTIVGPRDRALLA